jgi:hypothetical protein
MALAEAFVMVLGAYALAGLIFAAAFVIAGVQRIDAQAHGAGVGFRLLIFPGVAAFWPFLLRRWIQGRVVQ